MAQLVHNTDAEKLVQKRLLHNRLILAMVFVLILFGVLIARMGYLQWFNYHHYKSMADGNRISIETIPPMRGKIFDRNGHVLADNQSIFVLRFDKKKMNKQENYPEQLMQLFPEIAADKWQDFFKRLQSGYRAKVLTFDVNLTEKQAATFAANSDRFPGVTLTAKLKRYYPYKDLVSHALGYVGRISDKEIQTLDTDRYLGTDVIGKSGIEKQYEDLLLGYPGYKEIETNARGRVLRTLSTTPATPGKDIHLTLDIRLQKYAEKLLEDQRAAVVVMEPKTGEILAFISHPGYDLNLFVDGISQKNYDELIHNKGRPLINRVTDGQYPPGSTIKPFVSLGSLENGIITAEKQIFDPGYYVYMDHRYRDWKRGGHGLVNMSDAIEQSCDTYYYDLGLKMGIDMIHDALYPFGFGHETGIDLPAEKNGILPSKAWKKEARGQNWYNGETIIATIGQGYFLATPLQLAKSVATLANRGKISEPHLLKNQNTSHNENLLIPINKISNWEKVIQAMVKVMHGPHGTARAYTKGLPFKMAGKTGTAQVFSLNEEEYDADNIDRTLRDHSLFIGFAPVDNPEIAISVVIENASTKAAPVAVDIARYYFEHLATEKQNAN